MSAALNVSIGLNSFVGSNTSSFGAWGSTVLYVGLFIMLPLSIAAILIAALWNFAMYTRFKNYALMLSNSIKYAFIGGAVTIVVSLIGAALYWGYNQAKAGNTVPFKWTLYIFGGYILLAIIGKLVDRYIIQRVIKFEEQAEKQEIRNGR